PENRAPARQVNAPALSAENLPIPKRNPFDTSTTQYLDEAYKFISMDLDNPRNLTKDNIEFIGQPRVKTSESLLEIKKQTELMAKQISAARPDIPASEWDFALKDGKLVVTGDNLTDQDKAWMESALNQNAQLVNAVTTLHQAASAYFETKPGNYSSKVRNEFTEREYNKTFYNVASQMDGTIKIKEMVSQIAKKIFRAEDPDNDNWDIRTPQIASMGLGYIATQIKSSTKLFGVQDDPALLIPAYRNGQWLDNPKHTNTATSKSTPAD
ncbi:MAG TPA: hypothetical protein VFY35_11545, partial [Burkholderiaceae bacterium]|nr:hypothetical protein [Burkholderiaceae bacterium]